MIDFTNMTDAEAVNAFIDFIIGMEEFQIVNTSLIHPDCGIYIRDQNSKPIALPCLVTAATHEEKWYVLTKTKQVRIFTREEVV